MAIRKAEAPKVSQKQPVSPQPAADPMPVWKAKVDGALKNGIFSQREAHDLATALKDNPKAKGAVADYLRQQLETGKPVKITEQALHELGKSLGVDLKELFFKGQAQSTVAQHEVGAGLEKTAAVVEDKTASQNRLEKQKAILDGKAGVVDRPIGGVKGASYDAAGVLLGHLEGKLDERLDPELREAKDFLKAPLLDVGKKVLANPETKARLGALQESLGKPGFALKLGETTTSMGRTIADTAGLTAVNTANVHAAVSGVHGVVEQLGAITKGGPLEKVVAENGANFAQSVAGIGAKLTGGAKVAAAGAEAAQGAKVVAQAGVAGAEAAGQAVPGPNFVLGLGFSAAALVEFGGHVMHKPRSAAKILASLGNVVGQVVGIFLPGIGAAATGGKFVADRMIASHEKKKGIESAPALTLKDVTPQLTAATNMVSAYCDGAGHETASAKLRALNAQVQAMADQGLSTKDVAHMTPEERDALEHTMRAVSVDVEKVSQDFKGTPTEAAFHLAGQGVNLLIAALRKAKNVDTAADPEAEKKKIAGDAMQAAGTVAAAEALAAADAGRV